MARFRAETVQPPTAMIFAELFYPADAAETMARTPAMFRSHEEAENAVVALLREGFPEKPARRG